MQSTRAVFFLLVLNEILSLAFGIKWLSIATLSSTGHGHDQGQGQGLLLRREEECDRVQGLVRKQVQLCRRSLEMMTAVRDGAIEAIAECQHQFKDRRWNCSTTTTARGREGSRGHGGPPPPEVFGKLGNSATREVAFIHSITSGGVAFSVTKACSAGLLERCGCDGSVDAAAADDDDAGARSRGSKSDFEWSGCSDNIAYGVAFSRAFVDARERVKGKLGAKALMSLHNNHAGRKAIEDMMWTQCKCHGVSGSCELKTCWRSMPRFRSVASTLRDRYDAATEVVELRSGTRRELVPKNPPPPPPPPTTLPLHRPAGAAPDTGLVYLEASPDFCEPDARTGSPGTRGRRCEDRASGANVTDDVDADDGGSCDVMCCGRGHVTTRTTVVERCNCKFHWCCYVKCQRCTVEVRDDVCR